MKKILILLLVTTVFAQDYHLNFDGNSHIKAVHIQFSENLNCLYGPYEHCVWDISPNKRRKHKVFDKIFDFERTQRPTFKNVI